MTSEMHRTRAMAVLAMAALVMTDAYCVAAEPAKTGAANTRAAATDSTVQETTAPNNGQPAMKFRQYYLWSEPAGIALIAYSAIGLALILERLFAWAAVGASSGQIRRQIKGLLSSPDRNLLLATFQKSKAPLSRVMVDVLENGVTNSPETTQLLMENALDGVERRLKRNLASWRAWRARPRSSACSARCWASWTRSTRSPGRDLAAQPSSPTASGRR